MAYAEEKIAAALRRGDTRAAEYWRHVYAAAYTGAPRINGRYVELHAIFAVTPQKEGPAVTDIPQDPTPLPTRAIRRGTLGEMVAEQAAEVDGADTYAWLTVVTDRTGVAFNSSI